MSSRFGKRLAYISGMQVALPTQIDSGKTPGTAVWADGRPEKTFSDVLSQQSTTEGAGASALRPGSKPHAQSPIGPAPRNAAARSANAAQPDPQPVTSEFHEPVGVISAFLPAPQAGGFPPVSGTVTSTGSMGDTLSGAGESTLPNSTPATMPDASSPNTVQIAYPQAQPTSTLSAPGRFWALAPAPDAKDSVATASQVADLMSGPLPQAEATIHPTNEPGLLGPPGSRAPVPTVASPHIVDPVSTSGVTVSENKSVPHARSSSAAIDHVQHALTEKPSSLIQAEPTNSATQSSAIAQGRSLGPPAQHDPSTTKKDRNAAEGVPVPSAPGTRDAPQSPASTSPAGKLAHQTAPDAAGPSISGAVSFDNATPIAAATVHGQPALDPSHTKDPVPSNIGMTGIDGGGTGAAIVPRGNAPVETRGEPTQASSAASDRPSVETSGGLTHARLVQSAAGTQMEVSLRSEDFGRVTVHAGYGRDALSAQITLENPQLGAALSSHIPAMEQRLTGEHGMRTSVVILAGSDGQGTQDSSKDANAQSDRGASSYKASASRTTFPGVTDGAANAVPSADFSTTTQAPSERLNIRI